MTLNEMIYKRKSCRSFTNIPVDGATASPGILPMKVVTSIPIAIRKVAAWMQVSPWHTCMWQTRKPSTFAPGVPGYSHIGSVTL